MCNKIKFLLIVHRAFLSFSLCFSLGTCDLLSPCDYLRLKFLLMVSGHSPVDMGCWNCKTSTVEQEEKIFHSETGVYSLQGFPPTEQY